MGMNDGRQFCDSEISVCSEILEVDLQQKLSQPTLQKFPSTFAPTFLRSLLLTSTFQHKILEMLAAEIIERK